VEIWSQDLTRLAPTCRLGGTIQIDASKMYGANLGAVADVTVTHLREVVTSNTYLDIHLLIPGNENEYLDCICRALRPLLVMPVARLQTFLQPPMGR
jgi:hypothetical protein